MFKTSLLQWLQVRANTDDENNPGVNVETASATPAPREQHAATFDEDSRCFYVFGGYAIPSGICKPWLSDLH